MITVERHAEPLRESCASCGDERSHISLEFGAARSAETLCTICAMALVRRIVKAFTP